METTIEVTVRFCPKCKETRTGIVDYCGQCRTRIKEQDIMICMEEGEVTRVLKV